MGVLDSTPGLLLSGLYTAAEAALAAAGLEVPDEPGIVQSAPPIPFSGVDGCSDQLAVWIDRISARPSGEGTGATPGDRQLAGWRSVALLRVQLWNCHPNLGDSGTVPDRSPATLQLLRGAWAIWCEVEARRLAGTLFSLPGVASLSPKDTGMGGLVPLPPQGYAAGWQLNLEVGLPAVLG